MFAWSANDSASHRPAATPRPSSHRGGGVRDGADAMLDMLTRLRVRGGADGRNEGEARAVGSFDESGEGRALAHEDDLRARRAARLANGLSPGQGCRGERGFGEVGNARGEVRDQLERL